jgi:membrane-bound metal-dependent hydrolase YbcI (DUF457 family)
MYRYDKFMDIVTHALIGLASSAGLMPTHPALACGLVFGNVAPDLDAFSRLGGKHAFLRFHQTYTHSLAAMLLPFLLAVGLSVVESQVLAESALGFGIGMCIHVGLDLTNSYGVRCLWPLSRRRFALDWIFFIDVPIIVLTVFALIATRIFQGEAHYLRAISATYIVLLVLVVAMRGLIARRIRLIESENQRTDFSTAIIPTSFSPFEFLVCRQTDHAIVTSRVNAISGESDDVQQIANLDSSVPSTIQQTREWQVMRELSPHFHAVELKSSDGIDTVVCRDLRIRNFDTKFGTLTCQVDAKGSIISKRWEV